MDEGVSITSAPPDVPDWNTIDRDILCPLCDYNLRGLVEPRCPECGYSFEWNKLIEQGDQRHPYLFEHHPRRNIWSFFQTLRASIRPRKFWSELQPFQKPNVVRLLIYWLCTVAILLVLMTPNIAAPVYAYYADRAAMRNVFEQRFNDPKFVQWAVRDYGSVQAFKNSRGLWNPAPPLSWAIRTRMDDSWWLESAVIPCVIAWLAWPWLTFASLLIYRASMRQAKIHSVHVLRCVIYSSDAAWIIAPVSILFMLFSNFASRSHGLIWGYVLSPATVLTIEFMLVLLLYRLATAYRRYLRFPGAISAVIASQIIVALAILKLLFIWQYRGR